MYNCALCLFRLRNNLARNEDDFEGRNLAVLEWKSQWNSETLVGCGFVLISPKGLGLEDAKQGEAPSGRSKKSPPASRWRLRGGGEAFLPQGFSACSSRALIAAVYSVGSVVRSALQESQAVVSSSNHGFGASTGGSKTRFL